MIDATGASLTLGNLSANSIALTTTVANLTVGNVTIPGDLTLTTAGDLIFGDLDAFDVDLAATGSIDGGAVASGTDINAVAGTGIDVGNLNASDNVLLTALAGDLSTGTIDAGIDVTLFASGDVTTSHITAGGLIDATGASLTLGNLSANSIALTTTIADLTVGNVTIPGGLTLNTAGDLIFGDLDAFDVDLAATGSISGGDIDSATDITALAGTNMTLATSRRAASTSRPS